MVVIRSADRMARKASRKNTRIHSLKYGAAQAGRPALITDSLARVTPISQPIPAPEIIAPKLPIAIVKPVAAAAALG